MSERGVFAVDRGVWDHPMFAPEPFTEREAWLWMVSAAAWAAKRVRVGRAQVELQRGQLAFATRFLAEKWKWAHSKVVRFLKRLETDTMVSTSATREATLITICNYDKYAFGRNASETQSETQSDTQPERQRNKEKEVKKDNNQELRKETRQRVDDWPADFGEAFWQAYPRKTEKLAAMKKLANLRKSGIVTFTDLIAAVGRYAASVSNTEPKYIKQPTTWLNAGCWADELPEGRFDGHNFRRGSGNGIRQGEAAGRGSIVNAADRAIENLEREIAADNEAREGLVLSLPSQRL
jgi:hypothetical protein